ncbi:MAG TPA: phosphatase PAP2 family protein, partial [Chroococcidiopsis sp.]
MFFKALSLCSSAHRRSPLPLLLGVYLPLLGFGLLAATINLFGGSMPWETALMLAIHVRATVPIDGIVTAMTQLGSAYWVAPVVGAIALRFTLQQQWRSLVYLLVTLGGCIVTNLAAKAYWHRIRPHLWDGYMRPQDFSFPSGHAMTSMAFAAVLIALTWGSRW